MSARGDAARRARWAARDKRWEDAQFESALESWLVALPEHLCDQLENDIRAILGERYGKAQMSTTADERKRIVAVITKINLAWAAGHDSGVHQPGHEESSMSLEQALAANTAALEANTAAILKAAGSTGTTKGGTTTKKDDAAAKPKHTREELAALMGKVKAEKSKEDAQALIKQFSTETGKLVDVPDDKIDGLYAAGEAKLKEEAAGEDL